MADTSRSSRTRGSDRLVIELASVPVLSARPARSFSILQFPEPTDLDAVYVDLLTGQMILEEPAEVTTYHEAFLDLVGQAASPPR